VSLPEPAKRAFAFPIAIAIGGIKEPDPGSIRGLENVLRNGIIPRIALAAAKLPTSKAAFGDLEPPCAQLSVSHFTLLARPKVDGWLPTGAPNECCRYDIRLP
jgi:hypothetical protein